MANAGLTFDAEWRCLPSFEAEVLDLSCAG